MSAVGLFLLGAAVTVVVAVALGLCILGAILDGRDIEARKRAEAERKRTPRPIRPIPTTNDPRGRGINPAA